MSSEDPANLAGSILRDSEGKPSSKKKRNKPACTSTCQDCGHISGSDDTPHDIDAALCAPCKQKRQSAKHQKPRNKARDMAAALTGIAALTGAALPDEERMAPKVSLHLPGIAIVRALAQLLRNEALFLRQPAGILVTVDEKGVVEPMPPIRFCTWVEGRVTFTRQTKDGEIVASITVEMCARILASDEFRFAMRPLKEVHLVRLPAWADSSRTAVKLLAAGYDEGTQSYTVDTVPYNVNMLEDDGRQFLLDAFAEFCFAKPDDDPGQPLEKNRSFGVQVAAMQAVFCRTLLSGALRPAIAFQANQQGSGKTLLLRMALAPVYGAVTVQSAPRDENEFGKLLTATAIEGHEYLVLDNLCGYFQSAELESFLTSPRRRGRVLQQTKTVDAENTLNIFITGNSLNLSPDLARRCLQVDLWYAGQVKDRVISKPVDEEWLSSLEARSGFLAALWSLVNAWNFNGCPRSKGRRLASFESFSAIVGGIVTNVKLADPISPPEVRLDERQMAWENLFKTLAGDIPDGGEKEFSLQEVIDAAEEAALLELLVGSAKNPKVSLGMKLAPFRGRQFTDATGRPFEFGHRKAEVGARYRVRILTPSNEEE